MFVICFCSNFFFFSSFLLFFFVEIEKVMRVSKSLPGPADYASPTPALIRPSLGDIKKEFTKSGSSVAVGFMGKLKETVENARTEEGSGDAGGKSGDAGGKGGD
jgi:hypothetical protein